LLDFAEQMVVRVEDVLWEIMEDWVKANSPLWR